MNINDIMYQPGVKSGAGSIFSSSSLLSIGGKGQIVEGLVSKVSDKISISFNGIEVSVPHSAVREAREGETRKFQIMDVSKDSIVLKEVGNSYNQDTARTMASTKVSGSTGQGSSIVQESSKVAAEGQEACKNIAILTGEDYAELENEEGAIEEWEEADLDHAVERIKEQKKWEEGCQESNRQLCDELRQGLEDIQKQGFLNQKSESQIAQILRDADIPATLENISKVVSALQMSQKADIMSDDARAYIVGNKMTPTIENIYHGHYSGSGASDGTVYDSVMWKELEGQIKDIIGFTGLDTQTATEDAKWLFANDLPITVENLKTLDTLRDIKDNMTLDRTLGQIVQAMAAGNEAEQALLDTSEFIIAREIVNNFISVTDGDIITAIDMSNVIVVTDDTQDTDNTNASASDNISNTGSGNSNKVKTGINLGLLMQAKKENESKAATDMTVIPQALADGMSEKEIQAVIAKRHIAEICLKMTIQSAALMAGKGINIETAPLEDIVKELRDIENNYYMARFGASGDITDKELGIMQEALQKTSDIANAPVSLVGTGVRQMNLITFNELHAAAVSETAQKHQFMEIYEKVATGPDEAYGDSIASAFEKSVPGLLEELGLEDTQANERAVRILGYNSMEVTRENIQSVKEYDASLNRVIDNMKPSVVLELIRNGNNPLDKTVRELDIELSDIVESRDTAPEEKYSRYLWQLEKSNAITEQEREGYIGVYRLLNNIEKTDGAAIGAVMQSKREMTLGNLLSAVRTSKGRGIDIEADSRLGGLESLVFHSKPIPAQIDSGFGQGGYKGRQDDSNRYYKGLVSDAIDNITPDAVSEITDGDMEKLLNTSLEKFTEKMKSSTSGKRLVKEYYDKEAEEVREIIKNRDGAEDFLTSLHIPVTVATLGAAEHMINEGYNPLKECYNRRNVLRDREKKEFEETVSGMADALGSETDIKEECEKTGRYMEEILARSYSAPDISSDELIKLKMLGRGIQLNGMMAGRRSYDIPLVTGDTITNMNVTIISGSGNKGRLQVSVAKETDGGGNSLNISAEFNVSDNGIKGLVLCADREVYDAVKESSSMLESGLESAGFKVKNLSCSLQASQWNNKLSRNESQGNTPTADLYKAAKIAVKYLSGVIK